ncbi:MAG: HlyD family efflux transporter periplasmic adaptor subunit [Saprospiraceae bacterium]|nr:HlyD family efflux transporter periplasmic adaptor subunit [Saprospiraceae bacterium]
MNRLVPFVGLLTATLLSALLVSCSATLPDERASVEAGVKLPETDPALIQAEDLKVFEVNPQARRMTATISGRVISSNTTQLFAEVQGKVEPSSATFKAGMNFKAGASLISINDTEFELTLESQRSSFLNVLTGILPDIKSDYPASYEGWFNYVSNYHAGVPLDSLPHPNSVEEKFFLTSQQVYTLYFQIKSLEERLTKYQITAPYSGTVISSNIDIGSLVNPGQSLGTIANRLQYELEAGVPLQLAQDLEMGTAVTLYSNEVEGTWTGRITRINNIVDPSTQNIPIYLKLSGKGLRAGMYLEGKIAAQQSEVVSAIPSTAMGPDESVLLLKDHVITRTPIKAIDYIKDSILVSGLAPKDQVILNQFNIPMEGIKIE